MGERLQFVPRRRTDGGTMQGDCASPVKPATRSSIAARSVAFTGLRKGMTSEVEQQLFEFDDFDSNALPSLPPGIRIKL